MALVLSLLIVAPTIALAVMTTMVLVIRAVEVLLSVLKEVVLVVKTIVSGV